MAADIPDLYNLAPSPSISSFDSPAISPINISDLSSVEDDANSVGRSLSPSVTTEALASFPAEATVEEVAASLMAKLEKLEHVK